MINLSFANPKIRYGSRGSVVYDPQQAHVYVWHKLKGDMEKAVYSPPNWFSTRRTLYSKSMREKRVTKTPINKPNVNSLLENMADITTAITEIKPKHDAFQ